MFVINIVITYANIAKKMEIKNICNNKLSCFFFCSIFEIILCDTIFYQKLRNEHIFSDLSLNLLAAKMHL